MNIFLPITKMETRDDGTLFVAGIASSEALDSQGEIVTADAMKAALPDFFKFGSGNLREMHQMIAAGRVDKAEITEDGKTYIECIVVDEGAVKKVQTGTYKGFSIGGRALDKSDKTITSLRLTEISLVDRPANPDAVISVWKADETPDPVEKGMWTMQRLIEALQCVKSAMSDAAFEEKIGEHTPEMVGEIKAAYAALGAVAQKYLGEELNPPAEPVAVEMGDQTGDLEKAGARYSKTTKAAMKEVHDMIKACDKKLASMGYDMEDDMEDADKAAQPEDVTKSEEPLADVFAKAGLLPGDDMADFLVKMAAERDDLKKRVADLEAQPAPAKAAVTAIEKSDDTKDGLRSDKGSEIDPNDPLAMFKAVLSRPIPIVGAPISKPSSAN